MILYGGLLSPFVMRVVLAARAKGLSLPVHEPEGGLKSAGFLKLNPIGKMPTLVDGDFALPESEIIVQYLDEMHPRPSILPDDPRDRARSRLISRLVDVYVVPQLAPVFQGKPVDREGFAAALGYIEHYLSATGPHALGADFTLADCALMPVLFFTDALNARGHTAELVAGHPKLAAYWDRAKLSETGLRMNREMAAALEAFMKARAG
ncbi:glutathione S-transferase family protein [Parapedomonas caeni]